ncbi:MAG: class I tRNA ligase family protein, partial [Anaerolineae bacterium]|nr:class I tRNA ligase family protein [Anaerolineae bacterium]
RETDTMAGSVCSSWYFLRFASPHADDFAFDREAVQRWLPVDLYAGGAEHATGHLLYARFFTRVLADAGLIDFREPFPLLRSQGVVHASDGRRMSKSRPETVVTPDDVVARHGADALRAHVLFIAPFEANVIWDDSAISGVVRWMERVRKVVGERGGEGNEGNEREWESTREEDEALVRGLHRTVRKVSGDIEAFKFNTAIAALMSFTSQMLEAQAHVGPAAWQECCDGLVRMVAPFTPDLAEELWLALDRDGSIHSQSWPQWQDELAADEMATVVVQINGKLRARVAVPAASGEDETAALVLADETIAGLLAGRQTKRMIVVAGRLVNVVV